MEVVKNDEIGDRKMVHIIITCLKQYNIHKA